TEFGNMTMYLKGLLWSSDTFAFSGGFGLAVPTADDVYIKDAAGTNLVKVNNESVHMLPFLGFLGTPTERFFYQGIAQLDIDLNGNEVSASSFAAGAPTGTLFSLGNGQDQTYMYLSGSMGYWMYLDRDPNAFLNG